MSMQKNNLYSAKDIWYDFFGFNAYKLQCVISRYKPKNKLLGFNFCIYDPYIKLLDYKP